MSEILENMNQYLIPVAVFSLAVVIVLSAFLFLALRELERTRKELREARKEIKTLTLHDEEIRSLYPLAEGNVMMRKAEKKRYMCECSQDHKFCRFRCFTEDPVNAFCPKHGRAKWKEVRE